APLHPEVRPMPHTALRRLGLRGRPARSRLVPTRLSARPALELLEARDVPASPIMIRAPYAPYAAPHIVASLPRQENPNDTQAMVWAIDGNALGDSITARIGFPVPYNYPLPGDGLYNTAMSRTGVVSPPVFLESDDLDSSDHWTTMLEGSVDVAGAPNGDFAIAYGGADAYTKQPP